MKKVFKEAYEKIKAPASLKSETLALMRTEVRKSLPQRQQKRAKTAAVWGGGLAGAVLCAALICVLFLPGREAVYITPMEDSVHQDTVELEDGVLRFLSERIFISVTPSVGSASGDRENSEQADDREENGPAEEITTQSGGTLTLYRKDPSELPEIPAEDWSHIGGQQVYVTALKTETVRYQAIFEKDGMACEITGTGVTQKEFIDYLYKKMKE